MWVPHYYNANERTLNFSIKEKDTTNLWETMVGLKDNGEKKNKDGVEKEKEKNDGLVTSETVEEKVVSEEEKQKSNKQATNKGKVVVNRPPIEYFPYLHAPSKKDKERQYKRFLEIFKRL